MKPEVVQQVAKDGLVLMERIELKGSREVNAFVMLNKILGGLAAGSYMLVAVEGSGPADTPGPDGG